MRKVYFGNKSQQYTMKGCTAEEKSLQKAFWVRKIAEERDRFNNDWVPTLNLGKTKYCKVDHEAIEVRAAWFKKRQKIPLECLEYAAVKCQQLDARGLALLKYWLRRGFIYWRNCRRGKSIIKSVYKLWSWWFCFLLCKSNRPMLHA